MGSLTVTIYRLLLGSLKLYGQIILLIGYKKTDYADYTHT